MTPEIDTEGDTVGAQLIANDADLERLLHEELPGEADELETHSQERRLTVWIGPHRSKRRSQGQ